jgi:transketolase
VDLARENEDLAMAVLDCDLLPSVKTGAFRQERPSGFIQAGIGEHNAAAMAGALSVSGVLTFWADFGVFGLDEVYNQQRLNDINMTSLKLVLTHCGLDVGEDGKTHQCLDYVGAFRDFFGWKVVVPSDPNQTDRAVRWAAAAPGDVAIAMGRSKLPVVLDTQGRPVFGEGYDFEYGRMDVVRDGGAGALLAMGTVVPGVVAAADRLAEDGVDLMVGVVSCPLALDDDVLARAASTGVIVTVEDHHIGTGLGSLVAQWLGEHGRIARIVKLGVDRYSSSGPAADLYRMAGIDSEGVETAVRMALDA